jgi:hypothetical protein
VANNYFTPAALFPNTTARSSDVNDLFSGVEAAFDLLPDDTDALVRGTSTFGTERSAGTNRYTVTIASPRTNVYEEGDGVVFRATHTNTGAATLSINGGSAAPMVAFDGTALVAGDISLGRYYEFRYDSNNNRFVQMGTGTTGGGSPVPAALGDLLDVSLSAPNTGESLLYDGANWVNGMATQAAIGLDELTDVVITSPATGAFLRYNGSNWIDNAAALDDLSDVIITSPANNEVLTYNGSNWVNAAAGGGSAGERKVKASGTTRTGNVFGITIGADDELFGYTVVPGAYEINGILMLSTSISTQDMNVAFTINGGTISFCRTLWQFADGTANSVDNSPSDYNIDNGVTAVAITTLPNTVRVVTIRGIVLVASGATPTIDFSWSPSANAATTVTIEANSFIELIPLF